MTAAVLSPVPIPKKAHVLIRYSDWKKPTDAAYAFRLQPVADVAVPGPGQRSDIRDVAREVLGAAEAERFEQRIHRWSGPEDVAGPEGAQPYIQPQRVFEETAWRDALDLAALEAVLQGTVCVMRDAAGRTDYVLRDHHMLDVALYHYRTTGDLPRALFHADRHSDWCKDSYLEARTPHQAATWWRLFEGLKRPGDGTPVLTEEDIFFTTAKAAPGARMSGRDVGFSTLVPWFVDTDTLHWRDVLARPGVTQADWLSLDLDCFQPAPMLRAAGGLLREPRFHAMMQKARVRVFVLSPQFTRGGDKVEWTIQGSRSSSLRLLNLLRRLPA
ncbi:MAG: hypothetical protein ABW123_12125 [Cystobacter sp.]